jgi:maltose O-acetyltransferase
MYPRPVRTGVPSERAKKQAGDLYDPSDPDLVAERERARRLSREYNETTEDEADRRQELLADLFGTVDETAHVEPPFRCDYGYNVHVGEGFYANFDCVVLDVCEVTVGENCMIGPGAHIYTATHPLDAAERTAGREYGKPVTIGDDAWIGGQATINPGVTVGDEAVVASGAVVTDDVPGGVVVQGNPAEVVTDLNGE